MKKIIAAVLIGAVALTEKVFNKKFGGFFIKAGWDIDEL